MGHDINPLPGARGAIRTGILIGLLGNVSVPFETGRGKERFYQVYMYI